MYQITKISVASNDWKINTAKNIKITIIICLITCNISPRSLNKKYILNFILKLSINSRQSFMFYVVNQKHMACLFIMIYFFYDFLSHHFNQLLVFKISMSDCWYKNGVICTHFHIFNRNFMTLCRCPCDPVIKLIGLTSPLFCARLKSGSEYPTPHAILPFLCACSMIWGESWLFVLWILIRGVSRISS